MCLFAGYRAHLLTKEYNFWIEWSLEYEKEIHFCFSKFSYVHFLLAFFIFFSLIFKLPATVFHIEMWYSGWENLVPLEINEFSTFFLIPFLRLKGSFFRFFGAFLQYNFFGNSWDVLGMWPIILGYIFPTIMLEISMFHFRATMVQGGLFLTLFGKVLSDWWLYLFFLFLVWAIICLQRLRWK